MKKFMTLLTVLFVFITMSFGQNTIGTTGIYLNDGVTLKSDGFTVTVNPDIPGHPEMTGTMVVIFNDVIDFTQFTHRNSVGINSDVKKYQLPNGGVYGIEFTYDGLVPDSYATVDYNPNTEFVFITEQDTIDAFNNGVNSVDTELFYNQGFDAGLASVDTTTIWNNGYDNGVVEGENTSADNAYNAGYTDGVNSTTGVNTFAVTNLNVYPNPADKSGSVTIDCDGFNNVKVFTITGQEIYTSFTNTFNVSDFTTTKGTYLLRVEDNDFNVTNTRLIVQ